MWTDIAAPLKSSGKEFHALESRIQDSHSRCDAMGVQRDAVRLHDILDVEELKQLVDTHAGLIAHAELLFAKAFQSLDDKRAMFILTDARARILVLYSHFAILNAAAQKGVCLGASLSEASLGTNAVSLALHNLESAMIRGPQHFCRLFHDWYCVAVPILGSNGRPIGCLDISTCDADLMGEKLALVDFLAKDLGDYCKRNAVMYVVSIPAVDESSTGTKIQLTDRQHQVLALYSEGLSYKQISRQLQLQSVKTVQEHLDAVRVKLGATNRRDCIRKAIKLGFLSS